MKASIERSKALAMLLAWGLAAAAHAEQADREKPIQVEANSVRLDDQKKVAIYEGRVVLVQGTLLVRADRIEMRQDAQGFMIGDATGKPVQFRQKMDGGEDYVEGEGNRLEYDARNDLIRLTGTAHLKRGEEDLRGNLITYNTRSEVYQAHGAGEGGEAGRVKAVILPRGKAAEPPAADKPGKAAKP